MSTWDTDTRMAMTLYDRASPQGTLDYMALNTALNDLEIPMHKRRMMRGIMPAIQREMTKFARRNTHQGTLPE